MNPKTEITALYGVIGLAGYVVLRMLSGQDDLVRFFAADIVMMVLVYIYAVYKQNSSAYDAYWSVIPFYFLVFWWIEGYEVWTITHYLVAIVISFWSWRLTHNWFRSWNGWSHEDWRYVNFRKQFGKYFEWINFSALHLYPTIVVFLSLTGLFFLFDGPQALNIRILLGCLLAFSGTILELLADNVLYRERSNPNRSKEMCIRKGLWAYSRNPNYLGEMMFWIGIAIIGYGAGAPVWTFAGALIMVLMFLFASIPMKEKRLMETKVDFQQYKSEVPGLIPLLGKRNMKRH